MRAGFAVLEAARLVQQVVRLVMSMLDSDPGLVEFLSSSREVYGHFGNVLRVFGYSFEALQGETDGDDGLLVELEAEEFVHHTLGLALDPLSRDDRAIG
jgi:hypothetical protein